MENKMVLLLVPTGTLLIQFRILLLALKKLNKISFSIYYKNNIKNNYNLMIGFK